MKKLSILLLVLVTTPAFADETEHKIWVEAKGNSLGYYSDKAWEDAFADLEQICEKQYHGKLIPSSLIRAGASSGPNVAIGKCSVPTS